MTTTLIPDATDGSRLGAMTVTAGGQTVYNASYAYNADDQRATDTVTSTAVDDSGNTSSVNASRGYTYDPSQGDSLVSVQNASGATIENYGDDGAGNLTNANGNVQTANNVNQLSGYAVNARGDVTSTANYYIQWDALNRPIEITPTNPVVGSYEIKLGYDSQNRWLWKDTYQWSGSAWVYAYTRNAVWDGSNLTAVTDQNGNLVQTYTWGPSGLTLITDYSSGTAKSYVPIADASGNTAMVIDALTGTVVASYTYDAYGNLLTASGPMKNICPFLEKGLYAHSEVPGLMFAQNRVTDGRIWLSRDPSGESSDSNLYQLYDGDPINLTDTAGTSAVDTQSLDGRLNKIISNGPGSASPEQRAALRLGLIYFDIQQETDAVVAGIQAEQDYLDSWHPFTFSSTIDEHTKNLGELEALAPLLHSAQDTVSYAWSREFPHGAGALPYDDQWGQTVFHRGGGLATLPEAAETANGMLHSRGGPTVSSTGDEVNAIVAILTLGSGNLLGVLLDGAGESGAAASVGAAVVKESSAAAESTGTGLSTIRYTQEGETFLRYESGNPAFSRVTSSGGLQPGTFAAPTCDGVQPVGSLNDLYNLPNPEIPRTNYFQVTPPEGTAVIGPRFVVGGSGSEVIFPFGTGPGSAGPIIPTPVR